MDGCTSSNNKAFGGAGGGGNGTAVAGNGGAGGWGSDGNGVVDLIDFNDLYACLAGPAGELGSGCDCFDFDDDGDSDLGDIAAFQRLFNSQE